MEKIISISLKLDFTPNTLGCYGLSNFLLYSSLEHKSKKLTFFSIFPFTNYAPARQLCEIESRQ